MNTMLDHWLVRKSPVSGAMAASIVYPDKTSLTQVLSEAGGDQAFDKIWRNCAEMMRAMQKLDLAAPCLRWLFENAMVYGCTRGDGTCLIVVTEKGLSRNELAEVEGLLVEFQSL